MKSKIIVLLFLELLLLTSCQKNVDNLSSPIKYFNNEKVDFGTTATPFLPNSQIKDQNNKVYIPDFLLESIKSSENLTEIIPVDKKEKFQCEVGPGKQDFIVANLTFALVRPFKTIMDGLSKEEFNQLIFEGSSDFMEGSSVYVSRYTYQVMSEVWSNLSQRVIIVPNDELFNYLIENPNSFGVLSFEELEPKWKVLKIGNISPLDKRLNLDEYPLNFSFSIICQDANAVPQEIYQEMRFLSNRVEENLTVVLMTGTTALTRATAYRMEINGYTYPGKEIKFWFDQSDFRHVSSETPFFTGCPYPDPIQEDLSFCSRPEYLELFEYLGINVIELTGNHLLDKGNKAFETSLLLFTELGYEYYAAGFNEKESKKPLLIEHNGNFLAFIGCNYAGPANAWADSERSGIARCDFDKMEAKIKELRQQGYLPIVTFQYYESNSMRPMKNQIIYFRNMIDAGAVIVSGSQSHVPMVMEILKMVLSIMDLEICFLTKWIT